MKDLTPIAEGDVVLQQREKNRSRNLAVPRDGRGALSDALGVGKEGQAGERVMLASEEREARRLERCRLCEPIARDVLDEARTTLAVRFRFLDQALWRMPLVADYDIFGIASDGRNLVFDPTYVVDRFKLSPNEVVRDVAHCLFHCVFRHPFMLYSVLRQPWDVACDIAIEVMLLDLLGDDFPSNMDRRARQALRVIRTQLDGVVTAERLYWLFCNEGKAVDLTSLAPMFFHDTHGLWYGPEDEPAGNASRAVAARDGEVRDRERDRDTLPSHDEFETLDAISQGPVEVPRPLESQEEEGDDAESAASASDSDSAAADSGADAGSDAGPAASSDVGSDAGSASGSDSGADPQADPSPSPDSDEEELARQWEDISRRIQVELETHLAQQGKGAGNLVAGLKALNRERYDYAQFLARFATLHEHMKVNPDEFDYIYYVYGLKHYGNMPLIEPLEYKEDRQVHDFVIAIDTSESCSGAVVQAFMRKTYNILKQAESFHSRVNVHVVQCDARIQQDTKITSLDQLELYLESLDLKGFGGTDFRPVFEYVDLLVEKGEFSDLQGLVYFTDGQGTFPRKPPRYDAVFAFLDDGYSDPEVPPWAYKVIVPLGEVGSVGEAQRAGDRGRAPARR